ncbi:RadC family protein [Diaphorobacter sp.]|uniref:RadC family protein n=1 Tax=Diaphorobacter sp. TaxID=1934310 RepID=UPI0028AF6E43|nr:DNA repair protein RadC [Diaphorobacter sp.]
MPIKDLPPDARPREKLLARGADSLSDSELLAIVLRTGIKGKGVLQLADELLAPCAQSPASPTGTPALARERLPGFGGIAGLLHAQSADLQRIKGLGPAKRAELLAVLELARRAMAEPLQARAVFDSPRTVEQYLQLHLATRSYETFAVLFLDCQNRLIVMEELFRGTLTQTCVYPREVVVQALRHEASGVVLAHNHPSGSVQASQADIQLTETLRAALALVDVRVLDHFIIARGGALSMAQEGLI